MVLLLITYSSTMVWMILRVEVVWVEQKFCMGQMGEADLMIHRVADPWLEKSQDLVDWMAFRLHLCSKETAQKLDLKELKETGWYQCVDVNVLSVLTKVMVFLVLLIQGVLKILRVILVS